MKKILLAATLAPETTTIAYDAPVELTDDQLDQVNGGQTVALALIAGINLGNGGVRLTGTQTADVTVRPVT